MSSLVYSFLNKDFRSRDLSTLNNIEYEIKMILLNVLAAKLDKSLKLKLLSLRENYLTYIEQRNIILTEENKKIKIITKITELQNRFEKVNN